MKGKGLKKNDYSILESLSTGFGGMMYETPEQREARKTGNTKEKDYIVDTCYASDTGLYETGISCERISDGDWVIVEEYETEKESKIGHKKWVKHMKTKPKKLLSIQTEEWEE